MAVLITSASGGTLSAISPAEQSGTETSPAVSGDAFAGVLAGIGAARHS